MLDVDDGRLLRRSPKVAESILVRKPYGFVRTRYGDVGLSVQAVVRSDRLTSMRVESVWLDQKQTIQFFEASAVWACHPFTLPMVQELQNNIIKIFDENHRRSDLFSLSMSIQDYVGRWAYRKVAGGLFREHGAY